MTASCNTCKQRERGLPRICYARRNCDRQVNDSATESARNTTDSMAGSLFDLKIGDADRDHIEVDLYVVFAGLHAVGRSERKPNGLFAAAQFFRLFLMRGAILIRPINRYVGAGWLAGYARAGVHGVVGTVLGAA